MSATGGDALAAVNRGETAAIESFVREHEALVLNYARGLLGDSRDGEEVAQDTFVRAIRAIQGYQQPRIADLAVRPWLLRIARNLALNRLRHNRARPVVGADLTQVEQLFHVAAPSPVSSHDALEQAMAELEPADREMVVLRFVDDLSYAEVAATVGCTESAARGRVFRALKRLRLLLLMEKSHADV